MARTALNNNPLQNALIDARDFSHQLFGGDVPETAQEAAQIGGCRSQVIAIMGDGIWRTLPMIAAELKRRYRTRAMETAISARVRDMRRKGFTVEHRRTRPGSNLYEYRAHRCGDQAAALIEPALPSADDLDRASEEIAITAATTTSGATA